MCDGGGGRKSMCVDWMGGGGRESMCDFRDEEFQSLAPYLPALLSLSLSYISLAAGVEVTCLGLCPESNCLLVDVTDGPRILVDCPLEPLGMKNFPVGRFFLCLSSLSLSFCLSLFLPLSQVSLAGAVIK